MISEILITRKQLSAIIELRGNGFKDQMIDAIAMVVVSGHTISRAARLNKVDRTGLSRNVKKIKKWDEIIRNGHVKSDS